ncbi:MAG TPA: DUF1223 domain-containing protein [Gammaproteobacteria bacterium]|nr:DUF1223 domain-containing protein [Gammaproteobacteria bacterium]
MKKLLLLVFFIPSFSVPLDALAEEAAKTAVSPVNRVALLELYTSEGCSSCPPADHFLSGLKDSGFTDQQLIPLAFHVTYWDYIGWKDRFAKKQYDRRQRELAYKNNKSTVYTPQFVLVGDDYRRYMTFNKDINKVVAGKSSVRLALTVKQDEGSLQLELTSDITNSEIKDVRYYFAIVENNLFSDVDDGENEGKKLRHDFVVRHLSGPYFHGKPEEQRVTEHVVALDEEWKKQDLSIVAFAENPHTGDVLQAVNIRYQGSSE